MGMGKNIYKCDNCDDNKIELKYNMTKELILCSICLNFSLQSLQFPSIIEYSYTSSLWKIETIYQTIEKRTQLQNKKKIIFENIARMNILFQIGFSVLFLHNRQVTSEFPVYAFQEGQYGFRRANTDSGGPIQIQEGQYGTIYAF